MKTSAFFLERHIFSDRIAMPILALNDSTFSLTGEILQGSKEEKGVAQLLHREMQHDP